MSGSLLSDRIALITGASRGIGRAAAVRLAAEGAHVILVARTQAGLEETDDIIRSQGGGATLAPLDLAQTDKIAALAMQVGGRFGKLDILVGNAGVLGDLSPIAHFDSEAWDKVLAVNLTANFHLLRCFDPLLKAAEAPRAIFVSSGVAAETYPYWGAYAVSKAALEKMVTTYAAENEKTPLRANLIDPGEVRTRMHAQAFPGLDPMDFPPPESVTDIFIKLADPRLKETGKVFRVY